MLFEVTDEEIANADDYEVDDYKRIETSFKSGKVGFIYVKKLNRPFLKVFIKRFAKYFRYASSILIVQIVL
jgi:predicted SnoaL-like aldol condensation-catalyzing enzyme